MSNHELKKQLQLAIVGICIVAITGGLGRFAYTPIIPYMQSSLSLTSTDIGVIASSNYFSIQYSRAMFVKRNKYFWSV